MVAIALLALCALLAWIGASFAQRPDRPDNAIDLKVQLVGAKDRVWLTQNEDGALVYQVRLYDGGLDLLTPEQFAERVFEDQRSRGFWEILLNVSGPTGLLWVGVGLLGQILFTGRMLVQWLVSEKHRRSVVPTAFWWMSLIGATMLLIYFIWRKEPIGVLGQATGWFIYVRNLWLIYQREPEAAAG